MAQSDHCPASPNALHSTSTLTPLPPSGDTGVTKAVSSSGKLVGDNPVIQFPAEGATQKEGEEERKEA